MNSLELKIPPPFVALLFALLMWLASRISPPVDVSFGARASAGTLLGAAGLCAGLSGLLSLRRAGTTINPTKPATASSLVTGGIYRFTRNPMYLGLLLCLLAWAVYLSSGVALLLAALFVAYINRFQIHPEERAMMLLFGDKYIAYKRAVRRWL